MTLIKQGKLLFQGSYGPWISLKVFEFEEEHFSRPWKSLNLWRNPKITWKSLNLSLVPTKLFVIANSIKWLVSFSIFHTLDTAFQSLFFQPFGSLNFLIKGLESPWKVLSLTCTNLVYWLFYTIPEYLCVFIKFLSEGVQFWVSVSEITDNVQPQLITLWDGNNRQCTASAHYVVGWRYWIFLVVDYRRPWYQRYMILSSQYADFFKYMTKMYVSYINNMGRYHVTRPHKILTKLPATKVQL